MDKRAELAARFVAHLQNKRYGEAATMLSDNAILTVPEMAQLQGRETIVAAMRIGSESGRGLDRVGFAVPKTGPEGEIVVPGMAPRGLLRLVAMALRKTQKVTVSLRFDAQDLIDSMEIAMK
jgi:hypothetical protein